MQGFKWKRTIFNLTLWDTITKPDSNSSIDFNKSIIYINFNKPLIVANNAILFGLSSNKKNINKRMPYL